MWHRKTPSPSLEKGYLLLFALLPWTVECRFGSWNLSIPAEPLMVLLGLGLAWELIRKPSILLAAGKKGTGKLFSIGFPFKISALWILWMAVATCFSSMTVISLKYWLVEAGHWWVFAVGMAIWPVLWLRALPYFALSMVGVTAYTVAHHSFFFFRADQALLAPMPFFPDHTLYAAELAMLIFLVPFGSDFKHTGINFTRKPAVKIGVWITFFVGLLLSSCRAALLSVGAAGLILGVFYLPKKARYLAIGALLLCFCSVLFMADKIYRLTANDVSIQERLNRWDCSGAMLATRPWVGFGPGTFAFQYFPFQKPEKMTRISVQEPLLERGPDTYGRGGGAHSEYWQAGVELGWPGMLLWVSLVGSTLWIGFLKAAQSPGRSTRRLALLTTLALLTYFLHALANNFLHDGRVAALLWGGMMWLASDDEPNLPSVHQ